MLSRFFVRLLLLPLLLTSCTKQPAPRARLTFAADVLSMAAAPVYVADATGLWTASNLDVEIKPFTSGRLALDALLGRSVIAATVVDVSVVLAALQGHEPRIIATFSTSQHHVNMVGR